VITSIFSKLTKVKPSKKAEKREVVPMTVVSLAIIPAGSVLGHQYPFIDLEEEPISEAEGVDGALESKGKGKIGGEGSSSVPEVDETLVQDDLVEHQEFFVGQDLPPMQGVTEQDPPVDEIVVRDPPQAQASGEGELGQPDAVVEDDPAQV
jgi:hypothetical protein